VWGEAVSGSAFIGGEGKWRGRARRWGEVGGRRPLTVVELGGGALQEGKQHWRGDGAGERRHGSAMARGCGQPEVGGDPDSGSHLSARGRERRGRGGPAVPVGPGGRWAGGYAKRAGGRKEKGKSKEGKRVGGRVGPAAYCNVNGPKDKEKKGRKSWAEESRMTGWAKKKR
jgi:hypothetical protein